MVICLHCLPRVRRKVSCFEHELEISVRFDTSSYFLWNIKRFCFLIEDNAMVSFKFAKFAIGITPCTADPDASLPFCEKPSVATRVSDICNPTSCKTKTCLSDSVSSMAADGLTMQGPVSSQVIYLVVQKYSGLGIRTMIFFSKYGFRETMACLLHHVFLNACWVLFHV